jgi:hypothetical protein
VAGFREAAGLHVGNVLAERGDALALEAAVFLQEIPIGLGVARRTFLVVAEDVSEKRNCVSQPGPEPSDMRSIFVCEQSQRARLCGTTSSSAA